MWKENGCCDFHSHTHISDGKYAPKELVQLAGENGITILAITDHNRMLSAEELTAVSKETGNKVLLIRGAEVSCSFQFPEKTVELHIVALFPDLYSDTTVFEDVMKRNISDDRRYYIEGILGRLREAGVCLDDYDTLSKKFPKGYIGRPQIAEEMVKNGYAATVHEAMDEYIGNFGKKRAFFENPQKKSMPSMEEVIKAIHDSKGVCILCHLYYYQLNEKEKHMLLTEFRRLAGRSGGMETRYRIYTDEERKILTDLAKQYDLFESNASDFHGIFETDGLDNRDFSSDVYFEMMNRWKEFYYMNP